jgi:undecaprenyl-diphosphatase
MPLDTYIINLAGSIRNPSLDFFMLLMTSLGSWMVVMIFVFLIDIFLLLKKKWGYLLSLTFSFMGGEVIVSVLKHLVARPRPEIISHLEKADGFSFPSGHAFIAVSFFGLLAYFIFKKAERWNGKILAVFFGAFFILGIGFSRIYLGVHWPTDVLGSYALGCLWVVFVVYISKKLGKFGF